MGDNIITMNIISLRRGAGTQLHLYGMPSSGEVTQPENRERQVRSQSGPVGRSGDDAGLLASFI